VPRVRADQRKYLSTVVVPRKVALTIGTTQVKAIIMIVGTSPRPN
jgi:hypothetical protein